MRALPGGRVGWQRQRAWMEVFSSAQTTKSLFDKGSPSHSPAYRSSTRAALTAKSGSRGKIQDRCCHGLSASSANQRRIVEADTCSVMPRCTASRANSGQDHRDSGVPVSAGSAHARALTSATTTGANRRGRPLRGRSVRPSTPCWQNRRRHLRTVSRPTPNLRAIAALAAPSAAANTILARSTSRCCPLLRLARARNTAR
jgi:hypothetical protein